MRIRILTAATRDLVNRKKFYNLQEEGAGSYFLDSLYSDIDSLIIFSGIHKKVCGYFCLLSKRFP